MFNSGRRTEEEAGILSLIFGSFPLLPYFSLCHFSDRWPWTVISYMLNEERAFHEQTDGRTDQKRSRAREAEYRINLRNQDMRTQMLCHKCCPVLGTQYTRAENCCTFIPKSAFGQMFPDVVTHFGHTRQLSGWSNLEFNLVVNSLQ